MPPRKRKSKETQPTLEEVTDQPVKVVKSTKSERSTKHATSKKDDQDASKKTDDLFLKRRSKKTGVSEPAPKVQHEAGPRLGSDAGIWINRAPALTLWVSIVAQQQGFSKEAGQH